MRKIALMTGTILATLLLISASFAGVVIEQRVKDGEEKATQVILYCSENQLRTDHPESGLTTIMDLKADQILLIDHRSKGYLSMKLSLWEKEMASQLKKNNLPIRPRERKITVRTFGEKAVINGFNTVKIQVLADGELIEEDWMTKDIDMTEVDRAMEKATQGFSREFRSELKEGQEIQKNLKPHGFSVLVKDYTVTYGLRGVDVLEVKRIERKELKDEVFLPPSGYDKIIPQLPGK
jgi:hypothetical protein